MPRRTDIRKILIIGSGPIVIGHACEFYYSGTHACKALRAEGFEVVLVNSNPATIMTDPEFGVEMIGAKREDEAAPTQRRKIMLPGSGPNRRGRVEAREVLKVNEGCPNVVDLIKRGDVALIINTPLGRASRRDEKAIRRAALRHNFPCVTTMTGAQAIVEAICARADGDDPVVRPLQELHVAGALVASA